MNTADVLTRRRPACATAATRSRPAIGIAGRGARDGFGADRLSRSSSPVLDGPAHDTRGAVRFFGEGAR